MLEVLIVLAHLICTSEVRCVEAMTDCYFDDNVVWCTENKEEVIKSYWE